MRTFIRTALRPPSEFDHVTPVDFYIIADIKGRMSDDIERLQACASRDDDQKMQDCRQNAVAGFDSVAEKHAYWAGL